MVTERKNIDDLPEELNQIPRDDVRNEGPEPDTKEPPITSTGKGILDQLGDLPRLLDNIERGLGLFQRFAETYSSMKKTEKRKVIDPLNPTDNPLIGKGIIHNGTYPEPIPESAPTIDTGDNLGNNRNGDSMETKNSVISDTKLAELFDTVIQELAKKQDEKIGDLLPELEANKAVLIALAKQQLSN